MLYLTRLELRNIRCFPELVIDFKEPGSSAVLIGDNGNGKSTVLRSLAMGLCDQNSAAALFRELPGNSVRKDSRGDSFIQVDLRDRGGWRYRIRTDVIALEAFERIGQRYFRVKGSGPLREIKQDEFPWSKMFVSGYGPGIRTSGSADYSRYAPVDAVYSLFRYDSVLQTPELVIRRLVSEAGLHGLQTGRRTLDRLKKALALVLNLKSAKAIGLDRTGITISGPWGREELSALGDGYRATTTWTLDLISWWLLYDDAPAHEFNVSDLAGIVIVDELEQHLHPRWQRTILPRLRTLFPKIQFVVATHSPLVASSCPDIAVHRLENGQSTSHTLYGWRAEDVYDMMGVPTSRAATFQDEIVAEFARLDEESMKRKLQPAEAAKLRELSVKLEGLPPTDPSRLAIELHNLVESLKQKS